MIQSLIVVFSTQGKVKAGRRNAKQEFDEKITAVPPILNKVQTRSSNQGRSVRNEMKDCQFGNTGRVKESVNSLADPSGSSILRDRYDQSFCRPMNSAVNCIKGG